MIDKVIKSDMSIFASNISTLCAGSFFMLFLSSDDFFSKLLFHKNLSGTLSECQTVWTQIRIDILSVLICVQNSLQRLSPDDKSRR